MLIAPLLLAACAGTAATPMVPGIQVLPGPRKTLAAFQSDRSVCQSFAQQAVGDQVQGASLRDLGGPISRARAPGIGPTSAALGSASLTAARTAHAQNALQAQFDAAYAQCMYSLGNAVPGTASMMPPP